MKSEINPLVDIKLVEPNNSIKLPTSFNITLDSDQSKKDNRSIN